MKSRVTGKNQLTIPANLAREFKIVSGSEVEWSRGTTADTICLHVRPSPAAVLRQVREAGAPYRAKAADALRELERMRNEDGTARPDRKQRNA
jgi:bifunctional DNA-binding transcriptional regulator/antitoxin component of YhaV-PrlF toxin-antitoxin module